jgi:hypothetical protein
MATTRTLEGVWTIAPGQDSLPSETKAYVFRPNGEFFSYTPAVLNGLIPNGPNAGPPLARDAGKYTVDATQHRLTLRFTDSSEMVMTYEYTPAHILNGTPIKGGEGANRASLSLRDYIPGSLMYVPTVKYDAADSFCTSDADCKTEADDQLWVDGKGQPGIMCETTQRVCLHAVF